MKQAWLLAAIFALSGCGLTPLYGGGEGGPVVQTLHSVQVAPIDGRAGWLVRTALQDRLGNNDGEPARYRLVVQLDDNLVGYGVRQDYSETRERRTLRARYQLVEADKGTVVLDATAGSDVGIDVVSSDYANVAAEQTALERLSKIVADQIVTRIALFVRRGGPSTSAAAPPAPAAR